MAAAEAEAVLPTVRLPVLLVVPAVLLAVAQVAQVERITLLLLLV